VSGLTSGLKYKFRMVATNIIGDSEMSVTASFTASSLALAPGQPTVTDRSDTPILTIAWTAPTYNGGSTILSYNIYVDGVNTGSVPGTVLTYTETAPVLMIGATQSFKVTAVNSIGEGVYSVALSALAAQVPYKPNTPTKKSASSTQIEV
jgi:hypothetical protein